LRAFSATYLRHCFCALTSGHNSDVRGHAQQCALLQQQRRSTAACHFTAHGLVALVCAARWFSSVASPLVLLLHASTGASRLPRGVAVFTAAAWFHVSFYRTTPHSPSSRCLRLSFLSFSPAIVYIAVADMQVSGCAAARLRHRRAARYQLACRRHSIALVVTHPRDMLALRAHKPSCIILAHGRVFTHSPRRENQ